MPRPRRPPGAGPALTFLALLLLPSLLVAAQQQQPLEPHVRSRSPRAEPVGDAHRLHQHNPHHLHQDPPHHPHHPQRPHTPLPAQDARAVATKVSSAPALTAVRAHSAQHAASGGLVPSARSLQDWEVEDFVLLATVDGHIHARDRYNGEEIWELIGRPMLETTYNSSTGDSSLQDQPFVWIVEPREDGALYVLTPGPYPTLQSLGLTVKQLTDIAPYSSDDPELPVVYNVEKKTFMLLVDAATGMVKQSFSPGGGFVSDDSCAPESRNFFSSRPRDCRGIIDIGQTEYTITIHNKKTNQLVCTIKYAEWNPNSRDKDLQQQYGQTMDNQYIYSRFNGEVIAFDHNRARWHSRPLFTQPLPYPVARVFDVARPTHDTSSEPPLVLLPQPAGPAFQEEMANRVLLNTTDNGAWYALSEINYPAVTDGAPQAACYSHSGFLDWDAQYLLPDKQSLVGVHKLNYEFQPQRSKLQAIAAPTQYQYENGHVVSNPPETSPMEQYRPTIDPPPETVMESRSFPRYWLASFLTLVMIAGCVASYKQARMKSYWTKLIQPNKAEEINEAITVPTVEPTIELEPEAAEKEAVPEVTDTVAAEAPVAETVEETKVEEFIAPETKEKKVMFDIPDDEEDDLSPLSRTTTVDQESPMEDGLESTLTSSGEVQPTANGAEDGSQDPNGAPSTPKKKKTHRGKRGGRKLNRNQQKDDEEVTRIVDAAKQLEVGPKLHPDEVTMNGDDIQDVSNIKRIGKLTIDQDKLLGNGSGGTFVFEGKWKVSIMYQVCLYGTDRVFRNVMSLSSACCPSTLDSLNKKSSCSKRATFTLMSSATSTMKRTRTFYTSPLNSAKLVSSICTRTEDLEMSLPILNSGS